MKTKFFLIALSAVMVFCGCSDDDKNGSSALIGRWEAVEEVNEPEWSHLDYQYEEGELIIEFTDSRYKSYYYGEEEFSVAYKYQNGTLTVMGFDMKVEVSATQLIIYEESIDVEPVSSYTVYKKIN